MTDLATRFRSSLWTQSFRMLALTGLSFVLGYALTVVMIELLGLGAQLSYTIAILACSVVNFFGCRYWVFRSSHSPFLSEAARFFASILVFRAIEVAVFHLFFVASDDYRIAYVLTQVLSAAGKFATAKWFVFRPRRTPRTTSRQ